MANNEAQSRSWLHPNDVLKLHRLKLKKKQLQARISNANKSTNIILDVEGPSAGVAAATKRKNPFARDREAKRLKPESPTNEDTSDQTLFKLFNLTNSNKLENATNQLTSYTHELEGNNRTELELEKSIDVGKSWIPIDWALKSRIRLMSSKPFNWNQKLKISEEASGITGFVRCLDDKSETTLDTSSNAKFHQCCLYWQHPSLPWINLFPRVIKGINTGPSFATPHIRESLHKSWTDSLRSLFQLVRTRQCPYFYSCANNFTVLFRAAGISGCGDLNAIISPTTRGFRQLLKQEDIEFSMPLKSKRTSDSGSETLGSINQPDMIEEDETPDEQWLKSMGINAEDIKQINYTQAKIAHRTECEVDNSEESLILIEGVEVHAFYNFFINSKSITSSTGPLAGIPPTLLAPVAFHGAALSALKIRESKVRVDEFNYFSLEISGPILPQVIHNLCRLQPVHQNLTATFANFEPTLPFSKVKISAQNKENSYTSGVKIFEKENLSDCGLHKALLKYFCSSNLEHVCNVECLKYIPETKTYTWS